jgi:hypothetical protein
MTALGAAHDARRLVDLGNRRLSDRKEKAMLHVSLTRFGVVRGTSLELVEAAAGLLAESSQDAWIWDAADAPEELAA